MKIFCLNFSFLQPYYTSLRALCPACGCSSLTDPNTWLREEIQRRKNKFLFGFFPNCLDSPSPPCIFRHLQGFFQNPYVRRTKVFHNVCIVVILFPFPWKMSKPKQKKSRIREKKHLWTDADSSTDTTVGWTKNTQKPKFIGKRKKSSKREKLKNV